MTEQRSPRDNRFGGNVYSQYDIDAGYEQANTYTDVSRRDVKRAIQPYAKHSPFLRRAIKTNFRNTRGKNVAQIERQAALAVIREAGVKRRKLRTKINRKKLLKGKGSRRNIRVARKRIRQGYDIRKMGQAGPNIQDIKNKRTRRAARHIVNVRRNRAIMKTPLAAGKGYDIRVGHVTPQEARRANYWRRPKRNKRNRRRANR